MLNEKEAEFYKISNSKETEIKELNAKLKEQYLEIEQLKERSQKLYELNSKSELRSAETIANLEQLIKEKSYSIQSYEKYPNYLKLKEECELLRRKNEEDFNQYQINLAIAKEGSQKLAMEVETLHSLFKKSENEIEKLRAENNLYIKELNSTKIMEEQKVNSTRRVN